MGTGTAFLVIGEEHRYHGGIIPEKILIFYENDVPCWFDFSEVELRILAENSGWQSTQRVHRIPPHTPESPEFKNIITDVLLRYGMGYSEKKEELRKLKKSLERKYGKSFEDYMQRLDLSIGRKDCRLMLEKMREILETSRFMKKLGLFCLKGCPDQPMLRNLKRLKVKFEMSSPRKG